MSMRLLLLISVALFIIALICALIPTAIAGAGVLVWTVAGLLAWALDVLLGGWVLPVAVAPQRRP